MTATVAKNNQGGLMAYLGKDAVKNQINQVVGGKNGTRFISSIVSAVQATPALQECSNTSIVSAALLGEALNLSPSPQLGQYYLVPYKKKDKQGSILSIEAQFQLGAKGYKQLAMRTGQYLDLDVIEIRQGECLGRDKLNGKYVFEFEVDEEIREELPVVGYLAYFELLNGFKKQLYWAKTKMEKHADTFSQAFNLNSYKLLQEGKIDKKDMWKYSSFWYKNFDEMAEKTMIRQLISKWGIMSIDMQLAHEKDMAVIGEGNEHRYIDNETVEAQVIEEIKENANTVEFVEEETTSTQGRFDDMSPGF
jgi:recombinase, phage RecT family